MNNPASSKEDKNGDSPVRHAFQILRFLGTADATRALVNQLGRKTSDGFGGTCYFGIVYSPERAVARDALEAALAEPDRPIDDNFIDTLVAVERRDDNDEAASLGDEQKALEKIVRVLPDKRAEVFPPSLYSLSNYFWVRGGKLLPKDTVDRLVEQLLAIFDQLTPEQQNSLLSYRWEDIKRPALIPLLKRCAEQDSSDPHQDIHYNARTLAALAIRRWFELDPAGAWPAIISEMSRAKPRFGVRELGMLPDQTLPEVDRLLVEHFHGDEDFETASNLASLIARYGTPEILPQVLQKLDANIGKWGYGLQNPLLAYVLGVDPKAARPRLEKAIVTRDKDNLYGRTFFQDIAAIHYDPILDELAIRALDDSDLAFAAGAAHMLAEFGSSAAEAALWKRFEKWCKRWAGHEREVNLMGVSADYMEKGGTNDLIVGEALVNAIVHGNRWLTDGPKLQRLMAMSKVPAIQHQIEMCLEEWRPSLLKLTMFSCGSANGAPPSDVWAIDRFSARVAQYEELDSLDALKEKLSQFPPGTKFELSPPSKGANRSCVDDLRAFLASHEFSVTDAKIDDGS